MVGRIASRRRGSRDLSGRLRCINALHGPEDPCFVLWGNSALQPRSPVYDRNVMSEPSFEEDGSPGSRGGNFIISIHICCRITITSRVKITRLLLGAGSRSLTIPHIGFRSHPPGTGEPMERAAERLTANRTARNPQTLQRCLRTAKWLPCACVSFAFLSNLLWCFSRLLDGWVRCGCRGE